MNHWCIRRIKPFLCKETQGLRRLKQRSDTLRRNCHILGLTCIGSSRLINLGKCNVNSCLSKSALLAQGGGDFGFLHEQRFEVSNQILYN